MKMKGTGIILIVIVVLTGLSAGLGFGNVIGYMPGMKHTPANHMISFWQHVDQYFRARMPFFGNALLISLLTALFMIRKEWQSEAFLFIAMAFVACVIDLVIIITQNLPINELLQTIDPEKPITVNFEAMRSKAMNAYYLRAIFNILSFGLTIAGVVMYLRSHVKWIENAAG
jgi:uncharacterized membrane protein